MPGFVADDGERSIAAGGAGGNDAKRIARVLAERAHIHEALQPSSRSIEGTGVELLVAVAIAEIAESEFVGDGAIVGAGAVVTRDVAPREIVVGNPAISKGYRSQ